METTRAERIRLGTFLILMIAILIGFLIYVVGEKFSEKLIPYYTVFQEEVTGLTPGAQVMINGIDAGRVTDIRIDSTNLENVVVHFNVTDEIPIKTGMRVNMTSGISLTGKKNLMLSGGDIHEENVQPGGLVPAGASMMKQLTGHAETIFLKVEMLMNQFTAILSDENVSNFSTIFRNLSETTSSINRSTTTNEALLSSSLKKMSQTITHADSLILELQKAEISKTFTLLNSKIAEADVGSVVESLTSSLNSMDSTMRAFQLAAKRVDLTVYKNQDELSSAIRQLKETMENLSDFSRQIRENPSLLLRPDEKQDRPR
ncbi:MAG: MlaD family protein [Fibrobacter sp.]|jgi:phospholipid/cholesterol/gamma-HCH transport system substrate-binding protein|nr:MlaD family protein [Fibrobacter sp.]